MQIFFEDMGIKISKKDIKKQAKIAKNFCVLVKKKLARQQVPRDIKFRRLLALLAPDRFDLNEDGMVWAKMLDTHPISHPHFQTLSIFLQ